jgi:hypothetical protein
VGVQKVAKGSTELRKSGNRLPTGVYGVPEDLEAPT